MDPEKLWKAKKGAFIISHGFKKQNRKLSFKIVVDSTIHPDTGEAVFLPFRMSCFVPTNMVLVAGMLLPNPSVRNIWLYSCSIYESLSHSYVLLA
jgi:hypothetical protein